MLLNPIGVDYRIWSKASQNVNASRKTQFIRSGIFAIYIQCSAALKCAIGLAGAPRRGAQSIYALVVMHILS